MTYEQILTPDSRRYLALGARARVPMPFRLRWAIPLICANSPARWWWTRTLSLLALAGAAFWYGGGGAKGLALVGLGAGLSGIVSINLKVNVLVDAPAHALALLAADCWRQGWYAPAIVLAVCAGTVKESAPIFSAVYAWTPWLLVGLIAPLVAWIVTSDGPDPVDGMVPEAAEAVTSPFSAAWVAHRGHWRDPMLWVLPWGACLAGLWGAPVEVWVALALAYGQCARATDSVRLYQLAWPVLGLAALSVTPSQAWPIMVAISLFNPWAGLGV